MPKEVFTMTIRVLDDGTVTLTGPLDNKTLCYGLLESAKDSVREYAASKAAKTPAQSKQLDFNIGALAKR